MMRTDKIALSVRIAREYLEGIELLDVIEMCETYGIDIEEDDAHDVMNMIADSVLG